MSSGMVCRWRRLFQERRIRVEDEEHSGRPCDSIIEENVATVRPLLEQDRRLTLAQLFFLLNESSDCSRATIKYIVRDVCILEKFLVAGYHNLLTEEHKKKRSSAA